MRRLSQPGERLIKGFETGGWNDASGKLHVLDRGEPALKTYLDDCGVPTIGWGHVRGVRPGMVITRENAEVLFQSDAAGSCACVDRATAGHPTTANQFDAMASLVFNIGPAGFLHSTVLRKHLAGDYRSAARAFALWNKGHVRGQLVPLAGLTARRREEADLYLTGSPC